MTPLLRRAATLVVSLGSLPVLVACGGDGGTDPVVDTRTVAAVSTTPEFATVSVGATAQVTAEARDSVGALIANPTLTWSSLSAAVATVSGPRTTGSVSGVGPGVTRVVAQANNAADTTLIASLGPRSLLSTSFANAVPNATASRGQIVTVPVMLDMSRASPNGDLGSVQLDLLYNASLLVYQSAAQGVQGNASVSVPSTGRVRFTFTGGTPQGSSNLTLVTVTFLVPQTAAVDGNTVLVLNHTAAPTSTSGQPYEAPVTAWGRLRVAQ